MQKENPELALLPLPAPAELSTALRSLSGHEWASPCSIYCRDPTGHVPDPDPQPGAGHSQQPPWSSLG